MTPREENEVLAQWAGIECRCYRHHGTQETQTFTHKCQLHPNPPDYDRDEVAITLLPILVTKDFSPCLHFDLGGKWCMELFADGDYVYGISKPTIAAAIKAAVLQLIERENNI